MRDRATAGRLGELRPWRGSLGCIGDNRDRYTGAPGRSGDVGYSFGMPPPRSARVVVLGTGVSGMTTALCLAEAGVDVRIVADVPYAFTTSAIAGALWGPYVSDDPRVLDWSLDSLPDLMEVSRNETSGVRFARGVEAARSAVKPPDWLRQMNDFALCALADLPPGYEVGWTYSAPLFDMPVYLDYLYGRLTRSGVEIDIVDASVRSFREVARDAEIIVNCTGLGSRTLVPDATVTTAWGQLVVVDNPGINGFFSDFPESREPTYFIAHHDHVILGGHVAYERTDTRPDDDVADRILERCSEVEPLLRRCRVIGHRVGLRPVRSRVRLEREESDGTLIVHNYGHGGSGITLSWGCARYVQALIGQESRDRGAYAAASTQMVYSRRSPARRPSEG